MQNKDDISKNSKEVFDKVFSEISYDTFYYKHYKNPFALGNPLQVFEDDGEIVGINAFDQVEFLIGGQDYWAVQSGDSAVLEECRGKGIFSKIHRNVLEYLRKENVAVEFGFPNHISYKGFMKLGWKRIGSFHSYVKVLNIGNVIANRYNISFARCINKIFVAGKTTKGRFRIKESSECVLSESDIEKINKSIGTGVKRSIQYYQWRIDNNKSNEFKYFLVYSCNELVGAFIYQIVEKKNVLFLEIADWYIDDTMSKKQQVYALKTFLKEMKFKCDIVKISYVNKNRGENIILGKTGFFRREKEPALVIANILKNDENIANEIYNDMRIREMDVDIIMN